MDEKVDKFHKHEALDRTHLVICMTEDALINHPGCKNNKKAYKKVKKAWKNLSKAYQLYGEDN